MPSTQTSTINMSLRGVPPSLLTNSLLLGLYSANNGVRGKVDLSLPYNLPMGGTVTGLINLTITGPFKDTISSVLPITVSGALYRLNSRELDLTIKSDFVSILSQCFVEEADPSVSIELEDMSDCLGIAGQVPNGFDMFMKCDGTGTVVSSSLNMTIAYNPANIIMMTLRASGTQVTNTATVFMKASNLQTNTINMTIPVVHAVVTKPITFSTRGF